jgi:hypothetical protein
LALISHWEISAGWLAFAPDGAAPIDTATSVAKSTRPSGKNRFPDELQSYPSMVNIRNLSARINQVEF